MYYDTIRVSGNWDKIRMLEVSRSLDEVNRRIYRGMYEDHIRQQQKQGEAPQKDTGNA